MTELAETDAETDRGTKRRALSNTQVLAFVWRRWMTRPRVFAVIVAAMLAAAVCDLSIPWAAGSLVEAAADPARRADVAWGAWATLTGLYVLIYTLRQIGWRVTIVFAARNMEELINSAFRRVHGFSSDWHASTFAGSTVRKVSRGMWGYDSVSDTLLLTLGPAILTLSGLVISVMLRDVLTGLTTLVLVFAYMAANVLLAIHYVRPANLKSTALDSQIGAVLADSISGVASVKSFGAEEREASRFAETSSAWRDASIRTWNRFTDLALAMNVLLVLLQASLTGLLLLSWTRGVASPGDVAFGVTSFMLMAGLLRNFGDMVRGLQKGIDDLGDVAAYERTEPQVADRPGATPFRPDLGEIVFDRVGFAYRNAGAPLYQDFSLRIAPGERVALVGPTGAGKSTFVKLIQRLYDLDSGVIRIDGQDISGLTQTSLRRAVAVVPQDPALFHRTLAENIGYARPDAMREEIALAARRASAAAFIDRLPQGYDTLVGERGVKLSGGERQRVAIARAFLADAPILVLDEATSSLDVETERQVQAAMDELMVGRTTIVIAHRLSIIRGADRILVFQNGKVVEEGRHGELLARGGAYARLSAVAEGAA